MAMALAEDRCNGRMPPVASVHLCAPSSYRVSSPTPSDGVSDHDWAARAWGSLPSVPVSSPTPSDGASDQDSAACLFGDFAVAHDHRVSGRRLKTESTIARIEQRIAMYKPADPSLCSTVIVQKVPRCYTRNMLICLLDNHGFSKRIDFLFLPIDFATGENQGHAYVNLVSSLDAAAFLDTFNGFSRWWRSWDGPPCEVVWSCFEQGYEANVERYRNSPLIMFPTVPDDFRPALFSDGVRQPFPPPTRNLRPPRRPKVLVQGSSPAFLAVAPSL